MTVENSMELHDLVQILISSIHPDTVEDEIEDDDIQLMASTLVRIKHCLSEKVNQDQVSSKVGAIIRGVAVSMMNLKRLTSQICFVRKCDEHEIMQVTDLHIIGSCSVVEAIIFCSPSSAHILNNLSISRGDTRR